MLKSPFKSIKSSQANDKGEKVNEPENRSVTSPKRKLLENSEDRDNGPSHKKIKNQTHISLETKNTDLPANTQDQQLIRAQGRN